MKAYTLDLYCVVCHVHLAMHWDGREHWLEHETFPGNECPHNGKLFKPVEFDLQEFVQVDR